MKRAIIYTRVSTDEQASKGYSLRDQEEKLRRYCSERNIEVVNHVMDDASAKSFDRPGFQNLLRQLYKREVVADVLLILKWDRFSRNTTDAYSMIRELSKMNIVVQSIEQPIDFSVPENKVMLAVYLTIPEVENDRRSMNTIAGMRRAMKEGRWVSTPPIGYKMVHDASNKPIIIKSDKANLIEEAFRLYSYGGVPAEKIRKELHVKGLNVSKSQFLNILRNPVYAGMIIIRAFQNEPRQLVSGIHEPIVSKEMFDRCQEILNESYRKKTIPKRFNINLPLRGFLVCRLCGRVLTGSTSKGNGGTYLYYHCSRGCMERFRAEDAHTEFIRLLSSFQPKPAIVELYSNILKDVFSQRRKNAEEEIKQCENESAAVKSKLERINDLFINGDLDKESYTDAKERFTVEQSGLKQRLAAFTSHRNDSADFVQSSLTYLTSLAERFTSAGFNFKRRLIGSIFPQKLIFENKSYRTINGPSFIESIFLKINQIPAEKTKGGTKKSVPPTWAPPPGLEPGTL